MLTNTTTILKSTLIALAIGTLTLTTASETEVELKQRRLNGPRLGVTGIIPDGGTWEKELKKRNIGRTISQFGWHHEWLISPATTGPSFVVQSITFLGGVEYGVVIPSTSLVMGIRLPKGFEFGMGPNVIITDNLERPVRSALIMAVGKSLDFSGVSIPLNLAWSRNNDGNRISFVFGYALARKTKEG